MKCPYCEHDQTRILETRTGDGAFGVRRRRRCDRCVGTFQTLEQLDTSPLIVLTKDGEREAFDRQRLASSLAVAGVASLPDERRREITERVIAELRTQGPVISSQEIGIATLKQLGDHHLPTFVRYAIHFLRPSSIREFSEWLYANSPTVDVLASYPDIVVLKDNGEREMFDRLRIRRTLEHAAGTWISSDVDDHVSLIEADIERMANRETSTPTIQADKIGDLILRHLREADPTAYLHYAVTVRAIETYPRLLAEIQELDSER